MMTVESTVQAWRAVGGSPRPAAFDVLSLPPGPMPLAQRFGRHVRPRHTWRYVGVYDEELSVIVGIASVGGLRQLFWGLWDRSDSSYVGRTMSSGRRVVINGPRAQVRDGDVSIDLTVVEDPGVEVVGPSGPGYGWTRKQGGIPAHVTVTKNGRTRTLDTFAFIDDTDGYHARHLDWRWSAGVGRTSSGQAVAWNFVHGINDWALNSEQTVWVDGVPHEIGPVTFSASLEQLSFAEGGERKAALGPARVANVNRLIVRSTYSQPFADFSGTLPGVDGTVTGHGVMEKHNIFW